MTLWRNWIARWTSNPTVAGSNPVKVAFIKDNIYIWVRSSVVEHGIADPMVAGSIPVTPFHSFIQYILVSLDGQDTRFSPWRPGFDSRTRNVFCILNTIGSYGAIGSASDSRPEGWGFDSL